MITSDGRSTKSSTIPSLSSSYDETNRCVVPYLAYSIDEGFDVIVVRTQDTHILYPAPPLLPMDQTQAANL